MVSKSCVYKTVDGVDIALDAYVPANATVTNKAPILLWFHGGGLLQGTRKAIWPHLTNAPEKHGLCVLSADYRLAPQVRLPDIMRDIADLDRFIRSSEFSEAMDHSVDQEKVIISGGSAGGWLALLMGTGVGFQACGIEAPSKPLGVAAIYPITDLLDPFWTTKQYPVSYFKRIIDASELGVFLDPASEKTSFSPSDSPRAKFYHYMVQEALLSSLLLDGTGIQPEAFSIARAIEQGSARLLPVFLTHGTIDDKVPIQQSIDVNNALQATGSSVIFDVREGKDHLFDMDASEHMDAMYAFVKDLLVSQS